MKFDRTVAIYVFNDKNEIVLLKHKKFDKYLPPGGHVEPNELVHEAAAREVLEESGLVIDFISPVSNYSYSDKRAKLLPAPFLVQLEDVGDHYHEDFIYLARAKSSDIINRENHDIAWYSLDQALSLEVFDNVKEHLRFLKETIKYNGGNTNA